MNTIPIIKLEIQGMKHTVMHALTQYAAQMDETLQQAVSAYCADDNIERIINDATKIALDEVIAQEVMAFFRYGDGRCVVTEAVREALSTKLNAKE